MVIIVITKIFNDADLTLKVSSDVLCFLKPIPISWNGFVASSGRMCFSTVFLSVFLGQRKLVNASPCESSAETERYSFLRGLKTQGSRLPLVEKNDAGYQHPLLEGLKTAHVKTKISVTQGPLVLSFKLKIFTFRPTYTLSE